MSIRIRVAQATDDDAWDAFTRAHRLGSPFHLIAWKACIQESFGYAPYYLVAEEGQSIRGVLPLFLVKSWIIGKALISTPFAVYGGVLADTAEVLSAFREEVEKLAVRLDVKFAEIRNAWEEQKLGFTPINRHVIYAGPIRPAEEEVLKSIPGHTRRIVRRSLEAPFSTRVQTDDFTTFEGIYSRNLKRLGTPTFPTRYYRSLLKWFRGSIDIREVFLDGKPVAAVLTLYYQDRVIPYYGAADVKHNADKATTFMCYDLMRWAARNGFHTFDFGRSKIGSGSGTFKSHWGFPECPLHYEVLLLKGRVVPDITPKNPRYQLPIRIWRMLPLAVTRFLGPFIVKQIPA